MRPWMLSSKPRYTLVKPGPRVRSVKPTVLVRTDGSTLNAVKCPTIGYGRATWKCRMPANSGSGLPIASAPKWENSQFGLSSHHVLW